MKDFVDKIKFFLIKIHRKVFQRQMPCSESKDSIGRIRFFFTRESKNSACEICNACYFFTEELDSFIELEKKSPDKDSKSFKLVYYIAFPSLILALFREIMLCFFQKKDIDVRALRLGKGGWLPQDLTVKSKLFKDILLTQGSCFDEIVNNERYFEAINFFTDDNNPIHRNKVAHDICSSLDAVRSIKLDHIKKHTDIIFEFLVSLTGIVTNYHSVSNSK